MIRLCILMAALAPLTLSLAACGKYGPNEQAGPADQITYPKIYPKQ